MSILAPGHSLQQRTLKRAYPDEDFSSLQHNQVPLFNDNFLYTLDPTPTQFLEFLKREASKTLTSAFEIIPYFVGTFFRIKICIYSDYGVRHFYTALPIGHGVPEDAILFPTSTGAVALQFSESLQNLTAVPFFVTAEYAETLLKQFFNDNTITRHRHLFALPGFAKYRFSAEYSL